MRTPIGNAISNLTSRIGSNREAKNPYVAPKGEETPQQRVDGLKALYLYYATVDMYNRLAQLGAAMADADSRSPDLENFRNPMRLVVEFHAGHMFPGDLPDALPIETDNARIIPAIEKLDQHSNFSQRKQSFARWIGIREGYIKIAQTADLIPYKQIIDPRNVLEHEQDGVGKTTRILMQYRILVDEKGSSSGASEKKDKVYTEEWTFENGLRRWIGEQGGTEIDKLDGELPAMSLESMGLTYIPFVWAPFSELVPGVAEGSFEPHIGVADNIAKAATRLDSMLFRYGRPIWGLEGSGIDATGRPYAPPKVEGSFATSVRPGESENGSTAPIVGAPGVRIGGDVVKIDNDPFYRLPAGWTLKSLIANVQFRDAHEILLGKMDWAKKVMPELLYYQTEENANEAGIAVRYKLAGAIDRTVEARGNGETAIVRANQMMLDVAAKNRVQIGDVNFSGLGEYENGDFEHSFKKREVMPESPLEREQTMTMKLANAREMRALGYPEDEIKKYLGVEELQKPEPTSFAFGGFGSAAGGGAQADGGAQGAVDAILNRGASNSRSASREENRGTSGSGSAG